jgi:membrane protein YdbS with pleckstrin-like domain
MTDAPRTEGIEATAVERPVKRTQQAAAWIYTGVWRAVVDWLDVPEEPPALPVRRGEDQRAFRPAEGFLKYLKLWFWIVCLLIDLGLALLWFGILVAEWWVGLVLAPLFLVIGVVPDVLAYIALHLRYDTTWYVMTDRSLRIRRGVWSIHETTITFENVQNVKVTQGPVQRAFGIASVLVETAGSGASTSRNNQERGSVANKGLIEGVENAEAIRDLILARLRLSTTAGLGDEDDAHRRRGDEARGMWSAEHLAVLREIRQELGALAPPASTERPHFPGLP